MDAPSAIPVTPRLSLPAAEIALSFIRASGPGGQNVNKVATAVQLRFNARASAVLSEPVVRRLLSLAGRRATGDGEIVITAQRFRTQEANRRDAIERLVTLIRAALHVPKRRVATKPTRSSREQRLAAKKRRANVKRGRTSSDWD